jgi:hypothetical protein
MSSWISLSSLHPVLTLPPYFVGPHDVADLRSALRDAGFNVFDADVASFTDERGLLTALGDALGFPEYYAPNWDAFDDCVGDLLREDAGRVAVMVIGIDTLLKHDTHAFARSVHFLLDAVADVERAAGAFQLEFIFAGDFAKDGEAT